MSSLSPYDIVAICVAACLTAALLPAAIAFHRSLPDSLTGDPYLDHLYEKSAAKEVDEDEFMNLSGTWHEQTPLPSGVEIKASIIKGNPYTKLEPSTKPRWPSHHFTVHNPTKNPKGPRPYHSGRFMENRSKVSQKVLLTARQMEHINTERRRRGQPMLNLNGFKAAISHAWDQPVRAPTTLDSWTHFLILYWCMTPSHQSDTPLSPSCFGAPLQIDPSASFHGQGCYGGPEANYVTGALARVDSTPSPSGLCLYPDNGLSMPSVTPDPTPSPGYTDNTPGVDNTLSPSAPSATPDPTPSPGYTDSTPSVDSGGSSFDGGSTF